MINVLIIRRVRWFKGWLECIGFNESPITTSNDKLEPLGSRILDPMLKRLKGVNQTSQYKEYKYQD